MKTIILIAVLITLSIGYETHHASVHYDSETSEWKIIKNSHDLLRGAYAWSTYKESVNVTGWHELDIVTNSTCQDLEQAYAAGYLEGGLTYESMWNTWLNFANGTTYNSSEAWQEWVLTNDKWVRSTAADPSENVEYWFQVSLVLKQFDGILDGYNKYAPSDRQLTHLQFLSYQLQFEIGDIYSAIGQEGPASSDMENHCSSFVKPSADGKLLMAGHVTWSGYSSMLRIYKHYTFNFNANSTASATVSFSSFPGTIPSGDDFFITSSNLVVMETTNSVFNQTLYRQTTTETVPYYIRVVVANRMSTSGAEWAYTFGLYNSGTYNNQWIVVDMKLFTAGKALQPGTLWIAEQIPGYLVSADETDYLIQNDYWASYNVPFFPEIYNLSGYPPLYEKFGNAYSWSECARAQIFRRDQENVATFEDFKKLMRYNDYQNDPLSLQDACRGICARCDLNTPWAQNTLNGFSAFGAMDGKVTDNEKSARLESRAVSGPTWDSQPPFAWTEQWKYVPHYGQPKVFNFDFETMKPTKY